MKSLSTPIRPHSLTAFLPSLAAFRSSASSLRTDRPFFRSALCHPDKQPSLSHWGHDFRTVRCFVSTTGDLNPSAPVGPSLSQKDYTNNAFDALVNLVGLSDAYEVPQIESELLLKSLLEYGSEGLAARILSKSRAIACTVRFNVLSSS